MSTSTKKKPPAPAPQAAAPTTDALLDAMATRRAKEAAEAMAAYSEMAFGLARGEVSGAVAEKALDRSGKSPADLRADVEAVRRFDGLRRAALGLVALEVERTEAGHALARAHADEREAARRAREATAVARAASSEADARLAPVVEQVARLMELLPAALSEAVNAARLRWSHAVHDRHLAEELAAGRDPRAISLSLGASLADVDTSPATIARLRTAEQAARQELEDVLAVALDHEPDLAALRGVGP